MRGSEASTGGPDGGTGGAGGPNGGATAADGAIGEGSGNPASPARTRIFFTDLTSGPNSGGQNGKGAFVTADGNGLGSGHPRDGLRRTQLRDGRPVAGQSRGVQQGHLRCRARAPPDRELLGLRGDLCRGDHQCRRSCEEAKKKATK
jgi:hypothetical protein